MDYNSVDFNPLSPFVRALPFSILLARVVMSFEPLDLHTLLAERIERLELDYSTSHRTIIRYQHELSVQRKDCAELKADLARARKLIGDQHMQARHTKWEVTEMLYEMKSLKDENTAPQAELDALVSKSQICFLSFA